MADLVVLQLVPGAMTANLDRSLSLAGPHPWALSKYLRLMSGVRPGVYVAFMHLTRPDGKAVGRSSAYPAEAICHRIVLGKVVRPLAETSSPYFEGYPYEFWFDRVEEWEFSDPVDLAHASSLMNETVSGLNLDQNKLLAVLSNGRSSSMGMFFDGEPRLTDYFTKAKLSGASQMQSATDQLPAGAPPVKAVKAELQLAADDFAEAVASSGLIFAGSNQHLPRSFLAAAIAKKFVLLTGLSGSGKTQIARVLGQWFGSDVAGPRHSVIAVRSDWTTPEPLLGFEDALLPPDGGARAWTVPPALEFMLRAVADPTNPYLLVLDEMNLAHVERYFADVLSGMESGEPVLANLECRANGYWYPKADEAAFVPLPSNLFIVGTVNVDETTYQFSPKVLDRSFSFEFRVTTDELTGALRSLRPVESASSGSLAVILEAAADPDWHVDESLGATEDLEDVLAQIHQQLSIIGLEFGHRTYREALRLAVLLPECGVPEESVIDIVVMTKVLPRVHGSRRQLEPFLRWLAAAAAGADPDSFRMPIVARKAERMLAVLLANQYAGFAE